MDKYIRDEFLKDSPLNRNQLAYQSGKSTETALHSLVTLIEKSLSYQETALCAFLDIEGPLITRPLHRLSPIRESTTLQ